MVGNKIAWMQVSTIVAVRRACWKLTVCCLCASPQKSFLYPECAPVCLPPKARIALSGWTFSVSVYQLLGGSFFFFFEY